MSKTLSLILALILGVFALSAGPAQSGRALAAGGGTLSVHPIAPKLDNGAPATSVTQAVYAAPTHLHDFAPLSSYSVSMSGPPDVQFTKAESRRNSPLVGSNKWHGFDQQSGRNIIINLPVNVAVYSVSINLQQTPRIGVFYPDRVDFEVKQDGNWYEANTVTSPIAPWNKQNTQETVTGHYYNIDAKQIMIHFPVASWVFARQIHVWGVNASQSQVHTFPQLPPAPEEFGQAMTTADVRDHAIQNMLLIYNSGTTSQGTWTTHDFLPMVGHMTKGGAIDGRMFDTMLFLPTGAIADKQSAWYGFLSNLFSPGTQLYALNDAVGQVNDALTANAPNEAIYREKVVIALPYPHWGTGVWGQIGSQSITFNATRHDTGAVQSRTAALQWYIQTLLNAWSGANLTHLQLAGVYWDKENVNFQSPADPALIQSVAAVAAQSQLPLFWIPFYDAAGIDNWPSQGFAAAWLQSNYIQGGLHPDAHRLSSAIQLTNITGMGFEIETGWKVNSSAAYRAIYEHMLTTLEAQGMAGNVSHAFYAGSKVLVDSAYATNTAVNGVYQATYAFMQHG